MIWRAVVQVRVFVLFRLCSLMFFVLFYFDGDARSVLQFCFIFSFERKKSDYSGDGPLHGRVTMVDARSRAVRAQHDPSTHTAAGLSRGCCLDRG